MGKMGKSELIRRIHKRNSISKPHPIVKPTTRPSVHEFASSKEWADYMAFRDQHHSTCLTNEFIVTLFGTGIGECIKVKCPVCGAEEDITDISAW